MLKVCIRCGAVIVRAHKRRLGRAKYCTHACFHAGLIEAANASYEQRFWSHVEKTESCWIWRGQIQPAGYGLFFRARPDGPRRDVQVHRLSYELATGHLPTSKEFICHHCDNPPCVNPAHLFIGSVMDNMADMRRKHRSAWGEHSGHAKLSASDVRDIRQTAESSRTWDTYRELARRFSVSDTHIYGIVTGRFWTHPLETDMAPADQSMNESTPRIATKGESVRSS